MNKPTERIVVFVTPAQKRAIAATAERLGISVSELMRRAVLDFDATGDQVKAASIVDRLNAPRAPDALNEALQRAARPVAKPRGTRAVTAAGTTTEPHTDHSPLLPAHQADDADTRSFAAALRAQREASAATHADGTPHDATADDLQAAARVIAAKAAALAAGHELQHEHERGHERNAAAHANDRAPVARPRRAPADEPDEAGDAPASPTPDGSFA